MAVAMAFGLGALLATEAANLFGIDAIRWSVIATALLAVAFGLVYERRSLRQWFKGSLAERRVGQVIESALTVPGCAVAHSVYGIDRTLGDIDHLVVTPGRVWVVETKYAWVPTKRFPKVLRRIRANVEAVEAWLSPHSPEVVGCLVLASIEDRTMERRRRKSFDEGRVLLFNDNSIWKAIAKASALTCRDPDKKVARKVRDLSAKMQEEV